MVKELYISKVKETALNVTQTKVDSIRNKNITKSGCRIYNEGYIGISGTLGEATEETWNEALKNLENKVPYKADPSKDSKRTRDLRMSSISAEEFLIESEKMLEVARAEFPNFSFSNKIKSIESETVLKNDAGLEYIDYDRHFVVELVVKEKDSINIMDTAIMRIGRTFDIEEILTDVRTYLTAFNNNVDLPKVDKIPVIMHLNGFGGKIIESLNGKDIFKGTSILSDNLGKDTFSKNFTVYVDRSADNYEVPFFDAEGSIIENERFTLIEEGNIKFGYTDKRTSKEFDLVNTASANCVYDEVPSLDYSRFGASLLRAKSSDKTLSELIGDKEAVLAIFMDGGDCTNEGDFASPVQMSYFIRAGKVVGKLPEFSVYGNIYEMFGKDYLGQSSDKAYFGDCAMAINMNIKS